MMDKRDVAFWAAVGAAVGVAVWKKQGMPVPWKVYKHVGFRERRKLETHLAETMMALHKYEDANPGSISDETLCDVETEFTECMIDNDVMGVWNLVFRRKHPFYPRLETVLEPEPFETEEEEGEE